MKTNIFNHGIFNSTLFALLLIGCASNLFAQFTFMGDYDKSFAAPNGYYIDPLDIDPLIPSGSEQSYLYTGAVLNDGSILAGGAIYYRTFGNGDGQDFYIKKFLPSGEVDFSFGGGTGFVRTDFFRRRPELQPWEQNAEGSLDYPDVLKVQPDGKILFAGSCDISRPDNGSTFGVGRDFCLIRYNADGSLDPTFGNNTINYGGPAQTFSFQIGAGKVWTQTGIYADGNRYGTGGFAYDMALQSDGKIVVVGETRNYSDFFSVRGQVGIIVRYNPNGSLDSSFGTGGIVRFEGLNAGTTGSPCYLYRRFYGVALQPDGRIIAVGHDSINNPGGCFQGQMFVVTRWTADGQLETVRRLDNVTTYNAQAEKAVAVLFVPGNKVIVSGSYLGKATMVRLNLSDLSLDTSFGTNGIVGYSSGNRTLNIRAVQPDGKLIGSDDTFINGNGVVRFNPDGSSDQSFGNANWDGTGGQFGRLNVNQTLPNGVIGAGSASDILLRPNGKINLLGSVGGNCPPHLCRGFVSQQNTVLRSGIYSDFTNDGRTDVAVFRPSTGAWFYLNSANNQSSGVSFGLGTDKLAPADYDGDGKTDVAVFRNGTWYLQQSTKGFAGIAFGTAGDLPRPGDFDGDGRADIGVFRPSTGSWFYIRSSDNQSIGVTFGANGDIPLLADFDGDGKTDVAVFRQGFWYYLQSKNGAFQAVQFGGATDVPTVGDYDGDSKSDVAVFRESNGTWYRLNSSTNAFAFTQFGQAGDKAVPGDYDNDGRTDVAIFRSGVWYGLRSANNSVFGISYGAASDIPIPAAYLP